MKKDNPQVFIVFNRDRKATSTIMSSLEIKIIYNGDTQFIDTGVMLYSYQWDNGKIYNHPNIMSISKTLSIKLQEVINTFK